MTEDESLPREPTQREPTQREPTQREPTQREPTQRERGIAMMKQVYGWDFADGTGDFWAMTADHLFAEVWTRDALSINQRRMMLIGALAVANKLDVVELQLQCAYDLGELDDAGLREIVIFLAHYLGWPTAGALTPVVEKMIAKRAKEAAQ